MIFIYPCITSENVNRQIVPAAAKCMEQFFLLQLQNAFNDGVIGCVSTWDSSKHRYGPVVTESCKFGDAFKLVNESAFTSIDNVQLISEGTKLVYVNNYNKPRVSNNDSTKDIISESLAIESKLHLFRIKLTDYLSENKNLSKSAITKTNKVLKQICEDIKKEHAFRSLLEDFEPITAADEKKNQEKYLDSYIKEKGKLAAHAKEKSDDTNKNLRKSDDVRIDLTPTSVALDVDVSYRGGSKDNDVGKRTIMIGVKVVPIQIKNFKKVNDALLDDYFSRSSEGFWKNVRRGIARKLIGTTRKVLDKLGLSRIVPDAVDSTLEKKGDIVKQMITLAPSDFVNASAFRNDARNAPMNYKFTSSVVMFNKDDIDEDVNIFENRSAMNRLFRLGWTSFAVLDPVKEIMLFISSLDGGFLHVLPYSYMFNSLQANDIYKNESGLRNGTRPFSIRKGNFATFARSL